MHKTRKKTLEDLEFPTVREQLAARCDTPRGKNLALELQPFRETGALKAALGRASEYIASFTSDNQIPSHGFESIDRELKLLPIENTVLEIDGFRHIGSLVTTVKELKKFFRKFKEYFPLLEALSSELEEEKIIVPAIAGVLDRFGEIRDNASPELLRIRTEMRDVRARINQSFASALGAAQGADHLDEIRESVVENRRVLAVRAMYRKKVKGRVMGTSKTGSIVYIEPEAVLRYSRELEHLEMDEKDEVRRILLALTDEIRPYTHLLADYQDFLAELDLTRGKARYAREMNALLPEITEDRNWEVRDAYHPLLYLANKRKKEKTYPQSLVLDENHRIIVISGPNAGGKSITLKTIGLLQLMLQSGLLIPVHERSKVCLFDKILTDIGDNQSIENHLSTYSYRLKNMNRFLKQCDERTLFLIDEFGTGSDPELGGALAEACLEVFYERESYGVITTHYANLKLLADELPHMSNANMLFDSRTLEPTYQLELGQAGSSFTFEVAQKNGIPYSLINKAKKKIARGKLRFDATIAKMQKERSRMARTGDKLQVEEIKAREEAKKLETLNEKVKSKLENYQELYDHNQKMIYLGSKLHAAAEKYFVDKKKRALVSEVLRIVETENSKKKKADAKTVKERNRKQAQVAKEVQQKVEHIREQKEKEKKKAEKKSKPKPRPVLKVGDRVRLLDGKAVGSIDSIEKNKAVVNYGMFTTTASMDQLELVEAKKK